MKLQDILQNKL